MGKNKKGKKKDTPATPSSSRAESAAAATPETPRTPPRAHSPPAPQPAPPITEAEPITKPEQPRAPSQEVSKRKSFGALYLFGAVGCVSVWTASSAMQGFSPVDLHPDLRARPLDNDESLLFGCLCGCTVFLLLSMAWFHLYKLLALSVVVGCGCFAVGDVFVDPANLLSLALLFTMLLFLSLEKLGSPRDIIAVFPMTYVVWSLLPAPLCSSELFFCILSASCLSAALVALVKIAFASLCPAFPHAAPAPDQPSPQPRTPSPRPESPTPFDSPGTLGSSLERLADPVDEMIVRELEMTVAERNGKELVKVRREASLLRDELDKAQETIGEITDLKGDLDKAKEEIAALRLLLKAKDDEADAFKEELRLLEGSKDEEVRKRGDAERSLGEAAQRITELEKALHEERERTTKLSVDLADAEESLEQTRKVQQHAHEERVSLKTTILKLKADLAATGKESSQMESGLRSAQGEAEEYAMKVHDLAQELAAERRERYEAEAEWKTVRDRLVLVEDRLGEVLDDLATVQEAKAAVEKELQALRRRSAEETGRLRAEIGRWEDMIASSPTTAKRTMEDSFEKAFRCELRAAELAEHVKGQAKEIEMLQRKLREAHDGQAREADGPDLTEWMGQLTDMRKLHCSQLVAEWDRMTAVVTQLRGSAVTAPRGLALAGLGKGQRDMLARHFGARRDQLRAIAEASKATRKLIEAFVGFVKHHRMPFAAEEEIDRTLASSERVVSGVDGVMANVEEVLAVLSSPPLPTPQHPLFRPAPADGWPPFPHRP